MTALLAVLLCSLIIIIALYMARRVQGFNTPIERSYLVIIIVLGLIVLALGYSVEN